MCKSKIYTEDSIIKEAKKYTKRIDFQKHSPKFYHAMKRFGISEKCFEHMIKSQNDKVYSKEEILNSAKKYQNQRDWKNNEITIFNCAVGYNKKNSSDDDKKFWLSCIEHMEYIFKPNGYWTYDRCKEVSLKFKSVKEFRENIKHRSVYPIIIKNGWLDLISHLDRKYKPNGYWTYDNCKEVALKYKNRTEFMLSKDKTAYRIITKMGWYELLKHMKREMTRKKRVIYSYEFLKNKTVYVGLTCQIERRHNAHMGKETKYGQTTSPVYKFMKESGEEPNFKILTKRPLKEENAPEKEMYYSEKYKSEGWVLLNKAKPGSLGSRYIWTKDVVKSMSTNLTKHSELRSKMKISIYSYVKNNEWWEEVTAHLEKDIREKWTDEKAFDVACRYNNISSLSKKHNGVAKYIRKRPEIRKRLNEYWDNKSKQTK